MIEQEPRRKPIVREIGPSGFGNPDADISIEKYKNNELFKEMSDYSREIMISGEAFVPVTLLDCGCMDGRCMHGEAIKSETGEVTVIPVEDEEGERYKLAGGGFVMGHMIGLAIEPHGKNATTDFIKSGKELIANKIIPGGHIATGGKGGTGCKANDAGQGVIDTAVANPDQIADKAEIIMAEAGRAFSRPTLDSNLKSWDSASKDPEYFSQSSGEDRLDAMLDLLEVAKMGEGSSKLRGVAVLADEHHEVEEVYTFVPGYTFSQKIHREMMQAKFPDVPVKDLPQVFVNDEPRIREIAAVRSRGVDVDGATQAGITFALAANAAITDGSLRTWTYR